MAARKIGRRRGTVLTETGYQKLQAARAEIERAANCGRQTKEDLSKLTGLSVNTISKIFGTIPAQTTKQQTPVDKQTLDLCFAAFNLVLERSDYLYPDASDCVDGVSDEDLSPEVPLAATPILPRQEQIVDWGEAPCVEIFYGRLPQLAQLTEWVNEDRCKLITILGLGGIGKTALVTKLAQQLQPHFKTLVWRSLRNAPLITDLIPELVQLFSHQAETIPPQMDFSTQISRLLHYCHEDRCLLVLDNAETIISDRDHPEYAGYQELLRRIGESTHQSCLLLTSREKPAVIVPLEGEKLAVRTFPIPGLTADDSEYLFNAKGLSASSVGRARLRETYSGNPLALKIVATSIRDLFDGDIDGFLDTEVTIFNGISQLLDRQFEQLSPAEQAIMYWLAIEREWISPADLHAQIVPTVMMSQVLATLESLGRKSLIEQYKGKFTQQAMVMEYVSHRIVERVADELVNWNSPLATTVELPLCLSHPLIAAQSPVYIRTAQKQLLLAPIASQLQAQFISQAALELHLQAILASWRTDYHDRPHYGGGNLINLLRHWHIDLTNYNFANLPIWQANLQGAILHNVNFSSANFARSLFTKTFGWITALTFSPDSQSLVTGEFKGDLCLWQVAGKKHLLKKFISHNNWIWAVSFSPDGEILASAGIDGIVRLWNVPSEQIIHLLQSDGNPPALSASFLNEQILVTGHADGKLRYWNVDTGESIETKSAHGQQVYGIGFSPDRQLLATSSDDATVKIWDVQTGDCLQTLNHANGVPSVKFSPDGQFLATGCVDGTIQFWDLATWTVFAVFPTFPDWPFAICLSPDGRMLAAGNSHNEVKIWDISHSRSSSSPPVAIATLTGHRALVSSIEFSPDGKLLVTAGNDRSIRLWGTHTWHEFYHWKSYTNGMWTVAFAPDGRQFASGGQDGFARLWDMQTGDVLQTLPGYQAGILSVDYHPNGRSIACADTNSQIKIWDTQTGQMLHTLLAHRGQVWKVRYSPDGRLLASSGMENSVCLWDESGNLVATLLGSQSVTRAMVFTPDSQLLVTGSFDGCWRLWDVATETMVACHQGHPHWIWNLACSPDGNTLATSSADGTAKLWDIHSGELLQTLVGHTHEVIAIEFSPDGQSVATGSREHTIKIWEVETGQVFRTITGHQERISTLSYSPDGKYLVSGSADETIRLWDVMTGDCLRVCQPPAPYMGMNITGATGLSPAAIESLKTLGAIVLD